MIKTAIVGFGFSAKTFHLPFINQLKQFTLCAMSTSQTATVHQQYPSVTTYETASSMIEQTDAQLIIITSPNDTHFTLAKQALLNDKHVIIEKPFVTNVAQGEELIALAKQRNLVLSVYHNRRWDGDFLTVKKLIDDNKLGNVRYFESHFDRFRPNVRQRWRETALDGGGILFDLGPHLIDQALQLFGKPQSINAHCRILRENANTIDLFHLLLEYPDKTVALHASLFSASVNQRFQVQGDKGSYIKYGLDPQEDRLKAGAIPEDDSWADEEPNEYGSLCDENGCTKVITEQGGYQHFYLELADAIINGTAPPVSAQDALLNIKLIELALASYQRGETLTVA